MIRIGNITRAITRALGFGALTLGSIALAGTAIAPDGDPIGAGDTAS